MDDTYQLMAVQSQNWARKVHTPDERYFTVLFDLSDLPVGECLLLELRRSKAAVDLALNVDFLSQLTRV